MLASGTTSSRCGLNHSVVQQSQRVICVQGEAGLQGDYVQGAAGVAADGLDGAGYLGDSGEAEQADGGVAEGCHDLGAIAGVAGVRVLGPGDVA